MVEKTVRARIEESNATDDEWHVFVRDADGDTPQYVGTLVATDADDAHETATRLFAWYAHEVWVCRTTDLARYVAVPSAERETATPAAGDEPRSYEETEVEGPEE